MTRYCLDTSVFVQARNGHFAMSFCPAFWNWLEVKCEEGVVAIIPQVEDEICKKEDELSRWPGSMNKSFVRQHDQKSIEGIRSVGNWASRCGYGQAFIDEFQQIADGWLVGFAKAHGWIVVTHEVRSQGRKRIKNPNACDGLGVECIDPYEKLRREGANFILWPNRPQTSPVGMPNSAK